MVCDNHEMSSREVVLNCTAGTIVGSSLLVVQ